MNKLSVLAMVAACSTGTRSPIPSVRYANAPVPTAVNDRHDVPKPPTTREYVRTLYNFDGQFYRRVTRTLELSRHRRALGVNALDEVPSSTWFTNRIGTRTITPEELANAPGGVGSPELHKPWTIVSSKAGGVTVGFIIKDARGEKFLLKFDTRTFPEAETATHVIMGKLLWGFGFNVTEDYIVYLRREDLVIGNDAVVKGAVGRKLPLTQKELDRRLARIYVSPDGQIRALASHWLPGKPIGGHASEGVRADDPNDRIPHELRRDLRGAYALFSWLDHNDIHEGNLLDVWAADPKDPTKHYVKHYWIDFGGGLGFTARKNHEPRFGHEYYLDFAAITRSLLSFGAVVRDWEDRRDPGIRGVGMYEVDSYNPGTWVSSTPAYRPIYAADKYDKFWASKIIMRFTRDHIRAVVASARLSDPAAAEWLIDALIARQRATAKYWFDRVNPLDELTVDGDRLCFKDLSIAYAFTTARQTTYTVTSYDRAGRALGSTQGPALDGGVTCAGIRRAHDGDAYTIVRVQTSRPLFTGATYAYVANAPGTSTPRVIGIWRP